MLQTWSGLGRTAGGGIDQEQRAHSSNEFVPLRKRAGSLNPLSWSSKGLLVEAQRQGSPAASPYFMRSAAGTTPFLR